MPIRDDTAVSFSFSFFVFFFFHVLRTYFCHLRLYIETVFEFVMNLFTFFMCSLFSPF